MTNLTVIVLSVAVITNANVVELRSPGFTPATDRVIVTNIPTAEVTFKVTWEGKELVRTNTIPLATNVTKFGWKQIPLREERKPLRNMDFPPLPPGIK
jgi:hypothetical protein